MVSQPPLSPRSYGRRRPRGGPRWRTAEHIHARPGCSPPRGSRRPSRPDRPRARARRTRSAAPTAAAAARRRASRVASTRPTSPTHEITNPLFPVSQQRSIVFIGHVEADPLRIEVTLLPETKTIEWDGEHDRDPRHPVLAYLDGRIQEVAFDWYAQADDGSVWYLGEDVFNYEDGFSPIRTAPGWQDETAPGDDHARRPAGRRCLSPGEHARLRLREKGPRPAAGRTVRGSAPSRGPARS